jgi:hypothetical protein
VAGTAILLRRLRGQVLDLGLTLRSPCTPSRASALTGATRVDFVAEHVELRPDGSLARKQGHFAGKPIVGERFLWPVASSKRGL